MAKRMNGPRVPCKYCQREVPTYFPVSDEHVRLHYQKHYLDASTRLDWCAHSGELVSQKPWSMRDELALVVADRKPYTFSAPGAAALLAEFDRLRTIVERVEQVRSEGPPDGFVGTVRGLAAYMLDGSA